jgi:hypothetical protein
MVMEVNSEGFIPPSYKEEGEEADLAATQAYHQLEREKQEAGGSESDNKIEPSEESINAINIAWRAEGLGKVMEENGDGMSAVVENAILEILLSPTNDPNMSKNAAIIRQVCDRYNFDSGKRKYPEGSEAKNI